MATWVATGSGTNSTLTTTGNAIVQGTLTANTFTANTFNTSLIDATIVRESGYPLLPSGIICMWSGTSPPSGWGICDGRTYRRVQDGTAVTTPDLRGRFILGYCPETIPSIDGSTVLLSKNVIQQTGGEEKHTLLGSEIPSHTHTYSNWRVAGQYNSYKRTVRNGTEDSYTLLDVNNNNPSEPTQTTSSSGEGKAHNNMPPYYVLAYIMKI